MQVEYDPSSRRVSGEIRMISVDDFDGPLNYNIAIAESGIIDPQLDNNALILDYEHNHVLRDLLTSPAGDDFGDDFKKGEIYTRAFSYTIPTEDGWWVAKNCEIIAFVHESTTNSKRVLQAVSRPVIQ